MNKWRFPLGAVAAVLAGHVALVVLLRVTDVSADDSLALRFAGSSAAGFVLIVASLAAIRSARLGHGTVILLGAASALLSTVAWTLWLLLFLFEFTSDDPGPSHVLQALAVGAVHGLLPAAVVGLVALTLLGLSGSLDAPPHPREIPS